ncbi:MAG: hypothetical protein J3K34DRAFT_269443 [Monoraphidium minutum]|nr:MAG: hypothetical protein J3K34DRAFT_269443 [Monoraphidium minutum]
MGARRSTAPRRALARGRRRGAAAKSASGRPRPGSCTQPTPSWVCRGAAAGAGWWARAAAGAAPAPPLSGPIGPRPEAGAGCALARGLQGGAQTQQQCSSSGERGRGERAAGQSRVRARLRALGPGHRSRASSGLLEQRSLGGGAVARGLGQSDYQGRACVCLCVCGGGGGWVWRATIPTSC